MSTFISLLFQASVSLLEGYNSDDTLCKPAPRIEDTQGQRTGQSRITRAGDRCFSDVEQVESESTKAPNAVLGVLYDPNHYSILVHGFICDRSAEYKGRVIYNSPDFDEMYRSSSKVAFRAINALPSRTTSTRVVPARLARCASTSTPSPAAEILSKPPRSIEDSTSALDYKYSHRRARPPPLPTADAPRTLSAEQAVTNILYNTPPPSTEPYKK